MLQQASHASPDMAVRRKESKISRTQAHILWGGVPPKKKSAEILGPNIESAEVHYTEPEDGFRPNIGLNTKFRRDFFFSRSQVHNLCSGVPPKDQFRPKSAQWIPGHRISIFRRFFFQQISCPIIRRNGKIGPQSLLLFLIWGFNTKYWTLGPTYRQWVAHVIGRNLPG